MSNEHSYPSQETGFITSDLGLASALVTIEYSLVSIDRANRSRAQFVFRHCVGIEHDIQRFWDGELLVSARHLFDAQKMLKNRLYNDI